MQPEVGAVLPEQVVIGGYTRDGAGRPGGLISLRPRPDGAGLLVVDTLDLTSPSYLVPHPAQPWLFAVSESERGQVSSVQLQDDGTLSLLSTVATGGSGSCHLALAPDGRHLVVADYGSGSVSSVPVRPDGRLGEVVDRHRFTGSGPDPDRQQAPHAHQVVWDGDEVLVADLGTDQLHRLRLGADGAITTVGAVRLPAGSGPRHLVVLDDHLVVALELSGELWLGTRAPEGGWTERERVPSTGRATDGELYPSALRAAGTTVFVANRGPGTVAEFALDRTADAFRLVREVDGGGRWPRDLVVTDELLWVANQTDDVVTVLRRGDGPPVGVVQSVPSPAPACVLLLAGRGDNLVP